mmetsp:Transcript_24458/g.44878  ORF Transcript_24458/g.44878 Transcript_24458/m.44878 type:complete len:349 (+) Transcript_24458:27-1073(+)
MSPLRRRAAAGCSLLGACLLWRNRSQQASTFAIGYHDGVKVDPRASYDKKPRLGNARQSASLLRSSSKEASTLAASAMVGSAAMGSGRRRRQHWRSPCAASATEGGSSGKNDTEEEPEVRRKTDMSSTQEEEPEIRRTTDIAKSSPPASEAASPSQSSGSGGGGEFQLTPELKEDLTTFFASLAVALTIRALLVEPRFIPSLSMYPTFDVGDQLTVDKISKQWRQYQRGDVIVFNPPQTFFDIVGNDRQGEALIKRLVALEGDTVEVKGGKLFVNGNKQSEAYTNEDAKYDFGPKVVPPGCVFVLGDNRNASLDGHVWGFLPVENIIGRATLKFWPPWHIGGVNGAPS